MDTNEEIIQRYLSKEMTDEEKEFFERRMEEDIALKSEVNDYQRTIDALHKHELKADLETIHKELYGKKTRGIANSYITGMAASIILVMALTYLLMPQEGLFDKHFEPYPNIVSTRSAVDGKVDLVMMNYNNAQYGQVIIAYTKMNVEINNDQKFYLGISYLATGDMDAAIDLFESLVATDWSPQAKWYLGLAYLKSNQMNEAKKTLLLIKIGQFKYTEASDILNEIN